MIISYDITRDDISKAFEAVFDTEDKKDKVFDRLTECKNGNEFIIQYWNEEVVIYNTYNGHFLNWYKLGHVGRCFHTNMNRFDELIDFFTDLYNDITEENNK